MKKTIIISKNTFFKKAMSKQIGNLEDDRIEIECSVGIDDALEFILNEKYDVVFLDISYIGIGDDLIANMFAKGVDSKIVLITTKDNPYLAFYFQKYGIKDFIFLDDSEEELTVSLADVLNGSVLTKKYELRNYLTKRECEILKHISSGLTSKEIAEMLCISKNTVDTHRNKMLQKLDLANSASLVRFACLSGII